MLHGSKRNGRKTLKSTGVLAGPLVTMLCVPALADPQGERVVHGQATFDRSGDVTRITAADKTVINYQSFNIGANETVQFIQPDAMSRVLNRIKGADPTQIDGTLLANGRVYIVNPAGIYFGDGALVNVGQLYAAAGNISNKDFLAGRDHFTLTGEVVNRGTINASESASLFGRSVANYGVINAPEGLVTMASGDEVYVGERGGHVFLKVSGAEKGSASVMGQVENAGELSASELIVGAGDMYAVVLHDSSVLTAQRVTVDGGAGTTTIVRGTIDASNDQGQGGSVHLLGDKVALYGADVDASGAKGGGEILVGGDFQGQGDVRTSDRTYVDSGTTLSANATERGDGGKVIVWADEVTGFLGQVNARGAGKGGDGGFAEVSGKRSLLFVGDADLGAEKGAAGTILFDPDTITVQNGAASADDGNSSFTDGLILSGEGPANAFISEQFLENFAGAVVLQANDGITLNNLADDTLSLQAASGTVEFVADFDGDGTGNFSMSAGDTIQTQGANLTISGNAITVHGIATNGGAVTLNAVDGLTVGADATASSINTGGGNFTAQANSDGDLTGTFLHNALSSIITGGGDVSISGRVWTLDATSSINAGAGDVAFSSLAAVSMSLGNNTGTANLTAAELQTITTSGVFSVGTTETAPTSVAIQNFDTSATITGDVVIRSQGDVNFVTSSSDFDGDLTITADGSITTGTTANVTVAGDAFLTADADGDNNDGGNADNFTIGSGLDIVVTGDAAIDAADFDIGVGGSLTAANLTIDRGSGGTIGFGVDAGEDMVIEEAELDLITTGNLTIGGNSVSQITIDSAGGGVSLVNISGDLDFHAGGAAGTVTLATDMTTPGTLTLRGSDGVTIGGNVLSTGTVFIDANADDLADGGTLTISSDFGIDSSDDDIIIVANDIALDTGGAAQRLDAGTADIVISHWSNTGTIGLGGGAGTMSISAGELAKMTAATLTIGGDGSNPDVAEVQAITIDGAAFSNIGGLVTLNATRSNGTVTFTGADTTFPGALSINAGAGVTLNASVNTAGVTAIDADFLDSGAGDFSIAASETLTVSGAALTVTADDMSLQGGVSAVGQAVTLTSSQTGNTIGLGTATGTMALSSAELGNITAGSLVIGGTGANTRVSGITVSGLVGTAFSGITTGVTLNAQQTGGTIAFNSQASVFTSGKSVTLNAENGVSASVNVTTAGTTTVRADFDADGGGTFSVADGATFSSGNSAMNIFAADVSLGGSSGTRLSGGALSITGSASGATIGLGDATGDLTLSRTELARISSTGATTIGDATNSGGITVDGVVGATDLAGIASTVLETASTITFSGADSSFGALTANADAGITIDGVDVSTSGATTLDADDNADGSGVFAIEGGGGLNVTGGAATVIASDVDWTGASGISVTGGTFTVTTSQTTRDISVGANNGGMHLSNAELALVGGTGLVIGAQSGSTTDSVVVDGVTAGDLDGVDAVTINANAAGGTVTFSGGASNIDAALTVRGRDGITVSTDLTTGGGAAFDADFNNDATGDFTLTGGSDLVAGGNVSVVADDADISGTINAAGFDAAFSRSTASDIFVGAAGAGFSLSTAELSNVTAGSLTVGGADVDRVVVDGLGAGGLANISGAVNIIATGVGGTGGTVEFVNGASTFAADLVVTANDGITIDTDVTAEGAATFDADANVDTVGTFDLAAGTTLTVNNGSAVDITAAAVTFGAGAALDNAGGSVTIQHSASGSIGLGSAAGDLALDNTTLGAINTHNLSLGGANTAAIAVNNATLSGITGTVSLDASAAGGTVLFENAAFTVSAGLNVTADASITVESGAAITAASTSDGDANFMADVISLGDDITLTNNGSLTLTGAVELTDDVQLQTSGAIGDDILIDGTVDGDGGGPDSLSLLAGAGNATVTGVVGGVELLDVLEIQGEQVAIRDSVTTAGDQLYTGTTVILGNAGGAATYTVTGSGLITDGFNLNGDTVLAGHVAVATQGGTADDKISFDGAIDGDGNGPWNLSLTANGLGDIGVSGAIGAGGDIGIIAIGDARDVTFGAVTAAGLTQVDGSGTTTFGGALEIAGDVSLTGAAFTFNGTVTTTGDGDVTIANSGAVDINAAFDLEGGLSQTGAGAVTIGANVTVDSDGDDASGMAFDGAATIDAAGDVVFDAGDGAIGFGSTLAAGANDHTFIAGEISFGGAVSGTGTLELRPDEAGDGIQLGGVDPNDTDVLFIDGASIGNIGTNFARVHFGIADGTAAHDIVINAITLASSTTFHAETGGTIRVAGAITGATSTGEELRFEGSGSTTVLSADVDSGGADIVFNDSVVIDENLDITLNSGGGVITITGTVQGTTGGGDESLTFDAGDGVTDGAITIGGDLTGDGAGADATGLADVFITNGGATSFEGVNISGDFAVNNPLTGNFDANGAFSADTITVDSTGAVTFDQAVAAAGNIDVTGTAVTFSSTVDSTAGGLTVTNSGLLTFDGAIDLGGGLTQTGGGSVALNADITTGDDISFDDDITTTGDRIIDSGSNQQAYADAITAGGNLTFIANGDGVNDGLTFGGAVSGSGDLNLRPADDSTDFEVGDGTTGANVLIDNTSLGNLADGWTSISLGYGTLASHDILVGDADFSDVAGFHAGSGTITITGLLNGTDDAGFDIAGATTTFDTGGGIATAGGGVGITSTTVILGQNVDAGISTSGGAIVIGGAIRGTAGGGDESFLLDADTGLIIVTGNITGVAGGASAAGLTNFTIDDASTVSLRAVNISGAFVINNALTGNFTTNGQDVNAGFIDLAGVGFDFANLTSTSDIFIDNNGLLSVDGALTTSGLLLQSSSGGTGTVELGGDVTTNGLGSAAFQSAVEMLNGARTVNVGGNALQFDSTVDANGADLTFIANSLVFNGGAGSITGGDGDNVLRLLPATTTTAIDIGDVVGAGGALQGGLVISTASVAAINEGFNTIEIGYQGTGEHSIQIGTVTFADAVEIYSPVNGANDGVVVLGTLSSTDDATDNAISVFIDGSGSTTVLSADIITAGGDIFIDDSVVVDEGADVTLNSGGGFIDITGTVEGTAGGGDESLTFEAAAGAVTVGGAISGAAGAADATGLTDVNFASAGGVSIQGVAISGELGAGSTSRVGGVFSTNGNDIEVGSANLTVTDAEFAAITGTGGDFVVDNSGLLDLNGAITLNGAFEQNDTNDTGTVELGGDIDTTAGNGDVSFDGDVTVTDGDRSIDAGTGTIALNDSFDGGTFDVTFTGNGFDITGGDNSLTGTGVLTIRPATNTTDFDIGDITGAGGVPGAGLVVDLTDLAGIDNTFVQVEFGFAGTGAHAMQIAGVNGASAFGNNTVIQNANGTTTFFNDFTLLDRNLTVNGDAALAGNADIGTGTGVQSWNGAFAAGAFDATFTGNGLDFNGGNDSVTGTGAIRIRPATESTDLDVGDIAGAGGTPGSGLRFGLGDLAAIADGFASLNFGFAGTGEHAIQVAGVNNQTGNDFVFDAPLGAVTFLNNFFNTGNNLTVNGEAIASANLEISTGTGLQVYSGSVDLGVNNVTFTGNLVSFDGGDDSVSGTGIINIRPDSATTDIDIGNVVAAGGTPTATGLKFGPGDLAALADGFAQVWFGYSATGAHAIQIGDVTGAGAFNDATFFWAPSGGSISVLRFLAATGDGSLTFHAPVGGTTLANAVITTANGDVTFSGDVTLADGADAEIDADGDVTFQNAVFGTGGGASESLTVGSGSGSTLFSGLVSGNGTGADGTGLADLFIGDALDVTLANGLEIAGQLASVASTAVTGLFDASATGISVGSMDLTGTNFAFADVTATNGGIFIRNQGGETQVSGNFDSSAADGDMTFEGLVTILSDPTTFDAGNGTITFGVAPFNPLVTVLDIGLNQLTLIAGDLDFFGMVAGGGSLVLQPNDATDAIDVGDVAAPQVGAFTLTNDDLAAFGSALAQVIIGRADGQHTNFQVQNALFFTNVLMRSPLGGQFILLGDIVNAGVGSAIEFAGVDVQLAADIVSAGGDVTISGVTTLNADSTIQSFGGDVTFNDTVDGGFALSVDALLDNAGNVNFRDVIGGASALTDLTVTGWDVLLNGIGGASAGVTGGTLVTAQDDVIFQGGTYNANTQTYAAGDENRIDVTDTTFQSNGSAITFDVVGTGIIGDTDGFQGIMLTGRPSLTITSGGANIAIVGGIDATAGGGGTSDVVLDAGGGIVNVGGAIGAGNRIGSVDFSGSDVFVNGVHTNRTQLFTATSQIFLNGDHSTATAGNGLMTFFGDVVLLGDSVLTGAGAAADDITFFGRIDGGFNLEVGAGLGDVSVSNRIGGEAALAGLNISGAGITLTGIGTLVNEGVLGATDIAATGALNLFDGAYRANAQSYSGGGGIFLQQSTTFTSSSDDISFGNAVLGAVGDENFTVSAGTATITLAEVGTNADGSDPSDPTIGAIVLTADEVNLTGNVYGDTIVLQPFTSTLAIEIGDDDAGEGAGNLDGEAGVFDLTSEEIARLAPAQSGSLQFDAVIIGRAGGSHAVDTYQIEFFDPTVIRADGEGASVTVNETMTGSDDASITIQGTGDTTFLAADILTAGNNVLIQDSVVLLSNVTIDTNGGNIDITGAINGGFDFTLNAFDGVDRGNITLSGIVGAVTPLANLALDGFDNALVRIGTDAARGVLGTLTLAAFDDNILNGISYFAGNIILAAGDENRVLLDGTRFRTVGGDIAVNDGVVRLQGGTDASFDSAGGDITFADGIDSSEGAENQGDVDVDAGGGQVLVLGDIGGTFGIGSFDVAAGGGVLLGADVTTGDHQTYNGNVTLQTDVSMRTGGDTGDDITFNGDVGGLFDLSIDTDDDVDGDGVGNLTINGDVLIDAFLATIGDGVFNGSLTGVGITIVGNLIDFNGDLTTNTSNLDVSGVQIDVGGNVTTIGGAGVVFSNSGDLNIQPGATFSLSGDFTQAGAGTTNFAAPGLATTGDISFVGPIVLMNNVAFDANNITLLGTVNSDGTARTFDLLGAGTMTINGDIGGTSPLAAFSMTATGSGVNNLGADVTTTGGQSYSGPTRVSAESAIESGADTSFDGLLTLEAGLTILSGGDVTFFDDIVGAGANPGDLTITINEEIPGNDGLSANQLLELAANMSKIYFMGNVGFNADTNAEARVGSVRLNVDPETRVPTQGGGSLDPNAFPIAATIVFGQPLNAGDTVGSQRVISDGFSMGFFEKLTAYSNLVINSTDTVRVGDMSILGSLDITAPAIVFQTRPAGLLRLDNALGVAQVDTDPGAGITILGVTTMGDALGNGEVVETENLLGLSVQPTVEHFPDLEGQFYISLPGGPDSIQGDSVDNAQVVPVVQPSFELTGADLTLFFGDTPVALALDGSGTSGAALATARAVAAASASELGEIPEDTSVGAASDEALRQLGIQLIDVGPEALLDSMIGWALYNDLSSRMGVEEGYPITRNRVDLTLVDRVVNSFNNLFTRVETGPDGQPVLDENGQVVRVNRAAEIKLALDNAVNEWAEDTGATEFDPVAFDAYLQSTPEQAEVASDLDNLRELLHLIQLLGLSPREYSYAKATILNYVRPSQVGAAEFEALVDRTALPSPEAPLDAAGDQQ